MTKSWLGVDAISIGYLKSFMCSYRSNFCLQTNFTQILKQRSKFTCRLVFDIKRNVTGVLAKFFQGQLLRKLFSLLDACLYYSSTIRKNFRIFKFRGAATCQPVKGWEIQVYSGLFPSLTQFVFVSRLKVNQWFKEIRFHSVPSCKSSILAVFYRFRLSNRNCCQDWMPSPIGSNHCGHVFSW